MTQQVRDELEKLQMGERIRIPHFLKVFSNRWNVPQYKIKQALKNLHEPLSHEGFQYSGASIGVLQRDKHTKLYHYILIGGIYRSSIRRYGQGRHNKQNEPDLKPLA